MNITTRMGDLYNSVRVVCEHNYHSIELSDWKSLLNAPGFLGASRIVLSQAIAEHLPAGVSPATAAASRPLARGLADLYNTNDD
ncbi:hypothetical protein [Roseiflexus castenholzii]|jgi:hypothetical protein|uniref:hypothetical protein n=1 Tax=Roseiflexus castenholzii TaxID=120962 RepID=UPI0000E748CB|nr:hypothetical protein [Roseiflexus castenholzii]